MGCGAGTPGKWRAPGIAHTWAGAGNLSQCPRRGPHLDRVAERARARESRTLRATRIAPPEERSRDPTWGSQWPRWCHSRETQTPAGLRRQSGPWGTVWKGKWTESRIQVQCPHGNRLCLHCGGGDTGRPPFLGGCHRAPRGPGSPAQPRSLPTARGRVQTSPRAGPHGLLALPPPLTLRGALSTPKDLLPCPPPPSPASPLL